jgi:hypothetical protein
MNGARTRLCITSFEVVEGTPRVIKTDHEDRLRGGTLHFIGGGDQLMWRVVAATAAAPTYFPAFRITEHNCHLDGGVWAKDPVQTGITEAIRLKNAHDRFTVPVSWPRLPPLQHQLRAGGPNGAGAVGPPVFEVIIGSQARAGDEQARCSAHVDPGSARTPACTTLATRSGAQRTPGTAGIHHRTSPWLERS